VTLGETSSVTLAIQNTHFEPTPNYNVKDNGDGA
jgi:hypothetical protein